MNEKQFMAAVVEYAQLCGWKTYHPYDSRRSAPGYPDLTLIRNGFLIFAELKSEKGKLTGDQYLWMLAINGVEGRAMQVDNDVDPWPVRYYLWRPSDWPEIERVLR